MDKEFAEIAVRVAIQQSLKDQLAITGAVTQSHLSIIHTTTLAVMQRFQEAIAKAGTLADLARDIQQAVDVLQKKGA